MPAETKFSLNKKKQFVYKLRSFQAIEMTIRNFQVFKLTFFLKI